MRELAARSLTSGLIADHPPQLTTRPSGRVGCRPNVLAPNLLLVQMLRRSRRKIRRGFAVPVILDPSAINERYKTGASFGEPHSSKTRYSGGMSPTPPPQCAGPRRIAPRECFQVALCVIAHPPKRDAVHIAITETICSIGTTPLAGISIAVSVFTVPEDGPGVKCRFIQSILSATALVHTSSSCSPYV